MFLEMSFTSGIPQSILRRRFSYKEVQEHIAFKNLQYEAISKEDRRIQRLAYWITCALSTDPASVEADQFEFKWIREGAEQEEYKVATPEEVRAAMGMWGIAFGGKIENKKD